MAQTRIVSAGLDGIDSFPVEIEVYVGRGFPGTSLVGLPDAALREAKVRVKTALLAAGHKYPSTQPLVVNLVPTRRRKEEGAAFDLPIALAILAAHTPEVFEPARLEGLAALGELTLSGSVRPFRGALAAAEALAETGVRRLLVARDVAASAALGSRGRFEVVPVASLIEAVGIVAGTLPAIPLELDLESIVREPHGGDLLDLVDVRGADTAKRALVLAAAGGHDLLLVGPPGSGKTMLAQRLPGLLPAPDLGELLEVTRIHTTRRVADPGDARDVLVRRRPFRAPHHTASYAALVGGGTVPQPGEISLAHRGVLFLDELPEFSSRALEALREPLESRTITISRARHTATFPADFQLVAAMNPCPCGYVGDPRRACRCSPAAVERYTGRISGPLLDRIDLSVRVPTPSFEVLQAPRPPRTGPSCSAAQRERVAAARERQLARAGALNARLSASALEETQALTPAAERTLRAAAHSHLPSARALSKVKKVARTAADLEGSRNVDADHVALALHLRLTCLAV